MPNRNPAASEVRGNPAQPARTDKMAAKRIKTIELDTVMTPSRVVARNRTGDTPTESAHYTIIGTPYPRMADENIVIPSPLGLADPHRLFGGRGLTAARSDTTARWCRVRPGITCRRAGLPDWMATAMVFRARRCADEGSHSSARPEETSARISEPSSAVFTRVPHFGARGGKERAETKEPPVLSSDRLPHRSEP